MKTCEIFSLRKSKADYLELESSFEFVTAHLRESDIDVQFKTELSADPNKIAAAVQQSLSSEPADIFLFANALCTSDSSSFKELFYELISELEASLPKEEEFSELPRHAPKEEKPTPKIKIFSLGDLGGCYKGYCFLYQGKLFVAVPYTHLTGRDLPQLLSYAVEKAQSIIEQNRREYPDGVAYLSGDSVKGTKQKEGFFRSFIPHKGDSRGMVIRKIVVLVAILAFIGALAYVVDYFIVAPMQNAAISAEIQEIAYRRTDNNDETTADGEPLPEQDWDALKKINKEIVGWIRIDGTPIDYPVLWNKKDDQNYQHYLKHNVKGESDEYGAIFVDYRDKQGTQNKNVILHGHNMLNGSMFHELVNYSDEFKPKLEYYKKHSVITFNTPEGDAKWKVISVFKASTLYAHGEFFNYMQADFNSDAEFMNFVYNLRARSMFNIPVMVNEDDQILTLSTCSYEFTGFRTVVVARKVRPGEDDSVDVQLATVNPSPLYPDVYYEANGGTRPDPLTFKTAYDKGLINWYDGKGNLEGSEDLTATIAANPTEPPTDKNGVTTATIPEVITYYQVIYRNLDGSQFAAYSVREGDPIPVPEESPVYEDAYFNYYFQGWDFDVQGVNFNALNTSLEIYPIFNPVAKN
jgi:sortase B